MCEETTKRFQTLQEELDRDLYSFFMSLQTEWKLDRDLLAKLIKTSLSICEHCKGVELLPKKLLATLYTVTGMIRAEIANFQSDDASLLKSALNELNHVFYLTLNDEVPSDRTPGIPRID